ncbi:MAG: hypothetical protein QGH82_00995, partial [Candidatus Woesearchaeota archaeon]|nr:hypothetical protein [Candidatus Woesearchaeota archaeon]
IGSREVLRQQTVRDAEDSLSDEARQALDVFRDAARVTREATEKGAVTDAEFDVIVEIERTFRERAESLLDAELANPNDPLNQLTSDILANAVEQGTLIAEENIAFTTPSRDARIGINKQTPDPSQGTSIDQPSINARSSNTDVARSEHLQEKLAEVDANIATLKDRANDVNAKTSAQTQLQDVDNTGFFDRQIPFATAKHIQVNRRVAVDANGFEFFEVEIQGEKAILRVPTDPKGRLSVAKVDGSSISQLLQKNAFQNLEEEGGFFETNNNLVRSDLSEKRFGALGAKIQNARTEDRQNRQEAESLLVQIDAANKERQALAAQAPANFRDTTAIANLEAADRKKDRQKLILLRSIQTDGSLSETQRAQILGKIQAGDLAGAQDAISKSQSRDKALLQDRLGQLSQATVEQEKQQSLSIRNAQTLSRLQDRATVSRQSLNENVLVRGNGLNTVQQKLIADALLRNDFDAARRVLDKIGLNSEEGRAQSIIVQKINTLETIQQNIDKEKQAGGTPTLSAKLALEQQQNLNALSQQLADASEGAAGLALKFAVSGGIQFRVQELQEKQEAGLLTLGEIEELGELLKLNKELGQNFPVSLAPVDEDITKLQKEGQAKRLATFNEELEAADDLIRSSDPLKALSILAGLKADFPELANQLRATVLLAQEEQRRLEDIAAAKLTT